MFRTVLLTGLVLAAFLPLYLIGIVPTPSDLYVENFDRLWRAVDSAYPYFRESGVDWDALTEQYEPLVAAVTTDEAYALLVGDLLAALDDRHTGVLNPSPGSDRIYFGTARALSDGIVIDQLGPAAQTAGLMRGDQLVEINGVPIEESLLALPRSLRYGATAAHRRTVAASNILSTSEHELRVTVDRTDGTRRTATLVAPQPQPGVTSATAGRAGAGEAAPVIIGDELPSGLGYIRIPTLSQHSGQDLVAEFDAALDALLGSPGLILDLRGNGGGSSRLGDRMAGRLLGKPFLYGWETFRLPLPQRLWLQRFPYRVRPRGTVYTGPVVLLIDTSCASSAEMLIVALIDSGRARAVGRRTAGSSGNPVLFSLPNGGSARFSTGAFRRIDGRLIEDVGVTPHVEVEFTVDDFRRGRDPDLEAAEALLAG